MFELIRKRAQMKTLSRVIGALIVIAISLLITNKAIVQMIQGPVAMDPEANYEDYEGKYVTYSANCILSEYVRVESKNRKTHVSKLKDIGYIVFDEANGSFLGIKLASANKEKMDTIIEESIDYFEGSTAAAPEEVKLTGTLIKIEGEELEFYEESLDYLFSNIPEYISYAIPYTVEDDTIAGIDKTIVYVFIAAMIIAFLYALFTIINFLRGNYKKHIEKYLEQNPTISIQRMESDFAASEKVGKDVWVGREWTIFMYRTYASLITNKDLIWAYYFQRTGKYAQSKVKTFNTKKQEVEIDVSEKLAKIILNNYVTNQPHIVVGYNKDLEKLFNKDLNAFLTIKYKTAATKEDFE